MTADEIAAELDRLFRAYQSPYAGHLLLALRDLQKDWPAEYAYWKDFVIDLMEAMDAQISANSTALSLLRETTNGNQAQAYKRLHPA